MFRFRRGRPTVHEGRPGSAAVTGAGSRDLARVRYLSRLDGPRRREVSVSRVRSLFRAGRLRGEWPYRTWTWAETSTPQGIYTHTTDGLDFWGGRRALFSSNRSTGWRTAVSSLRVAGRNPVEE